MIGKGLSVVFTDAGERSRAKDETRRRAIKCGEALDPLTSDGVSELSMKQQTTSAKFVSCYRNPVMYI